MPASITACTYSIVAALVAGEKRVSGFKDWLTRNPEQERFKQDYYEPCRNEISHIAYVKSNAVESITGLSLTAVLDLLVEWPQKGKCREVVCEDKRRFPGVRLPEEMVTFFRLRPSGDPLVCVRTKSAHLIYMTMYPPAPTDYFSLFELARQLPREKRPTHDFNGLIFPMVKIKQNFPLSWLIGMTAENNGLPQEITKANQENRLRMNETGARVQSKVVLETVYVGVRCERRRPDLIINRPFLLWVEDPKAKLPIFVAYIQRQDWRNPGDITAD